VRLACRVPQRESKGQLVDPRQATHSVVHQHNHPSLHSLHSRSTSTHQLTRTQHFVATRDRLSTDLQSKNTSQYSGASIYFFDYLTMQQRWMDNANSIIPRSRRPLSPALVSRCSSKVATAYERGAPIGGSALGLPSCEESHTLYCDGYEIWSSIVRDCRNTAL
jgi:hypothetical protein